MDGTIDLNSADQEALDSIAGLRGHGPEIVRYREDRGGFTSVDQLDEVPGLTGKLGEADLGRLSIG